MSFEAFLTFCDGYHIYQVKNGWFNSPTQVWPSGPMANPGGQEQLPDCLHLSIQAMSFDEHLIFSSAIRNIETRLTLDSILRFYFLYSRPFMNSTYYRNNLAFIRRIHFLFTITLGKPPVKWRHGVFFSLPLHVILSDWSLNPDLQEQKNEPGVFLHSCEHGEYRHSSMSENKQSNDVISSCHWSEKIHSLKQILKAIVTLTLRHTNTSN